MAKWISSDGAFEFWTPEENVSLFMILCKECERLNEANPNLVRINKNTWTRKEEVQAMK